MKNAKHNTHNAIHNTQYAILITLILACLILPQAVQAAAPVAYDQALITLTPEQFSAADVDGSKDISAYDAALIAQRAVGLITVFPVES